MKNKSPNKGKKVVGNTAKNAKKSSRYVKAVEKGIIKSPWKKRKQI